MTAARRLLRSLAGPAVAIGVLAAPAAACPYCALSQGTDTLIYIMAFLGIPYVIVFGTWRWMKHVLAQEQLALNEHESAAPSGSSGKA
jgi:hypothetical protein